MDCSPPGSSAHGVLQARVLSGLPCPPPGDLPDSGNQTWVSCIAGRFFTAEPLRKPRVSWVSLKLRNPKVIGSMEKMAQESVFFFVCLFVFFFFFIFKLYNIVLVLPNPRWFFVCVLRWGAWNKTRLLSPNFWSWEIWAQNNWVLCSGFLTKLKWGVSRAAFLSRAQIFLPHSFRLLAEFSTLWL